MKKIRVICVDDSALIRQLLSSIINEQHDMEVVATAPDPYVARKLVKEHDPDVMTLDIEMPKMNGLEFLEKIMRLRPMPVVMVSSLTKKGSEATMKALELGAVDFVAKPEVKVRESLEAYSAIIAEKIRAASRAKVSKIKQEELPPHKGTISQPLSPGAKQNLIIIGSSTGGTEAIRQVITRFPVDAPPILITQHMPEGFTASFAERMNKLCQVTVQEARDGEVIQPGHVYIAPGHSHLKLGRRGTQFITELDSAAPVNRHRPSVDVLFESAASNAGHRCVGVLLTGMGKDGAKGLLSMREKGAHTIAQDEASCVVFGMPKAAIEMNAACDIIPLDKMAETIWQQMSKNN